MICWNFDTRESKTTCINRGSLGALEAVKTRLLYFQVAKKWEERKQNRKLVIHLIMARQSWTTLPCTELLIHAITRPIQVSLATISWVPLTSSNWMNRPCLISKPWTSNLVVTSKLAISSTMIFLTLATRLPQLISVRTPLLGTIKCKMKLINEIFRWTDLQFSISTTQSVTQLIWKRNSTIPLHILGTNRWHRVSRRFREIERVWAKKAKVRWICKGPIENWNLTRGH